MVFNVEPLADFVDLVFVGDGEELVPEFLDRFKEWKRAGASRERMLREATQIEGIYVPSLYDAQIDDRQRTADPGLPSTMRRCRSCDASPWISTVTPFPTASSFLTARSCTTGCRWRSCGVARWAAVSVRRATSTARRESAILTRCAMR